MHLQSLPKRDIPRVGHILWGHAMMYAADKLSTEQYTKFGENDPTDLRKPLVTQRDMTVFGAEVLFRKGGSIKADRVLPPGMHAYYLGPHHISPKGSRLLFLGDNYHVETDSARVKPIKEGTSFRFMTSFPGASTKRPAKGTSNEWFCWHQCSICRKFRCIPTALHDQLDEWDTLFQCAFDHDDEGVARSCADPEISPGKDEEKGARRGQKNTRKHAGEEPKKPGRKPGQKDTKPRKPYTRRNVDKPVAMTAKIGCPNPVAGADEDCLGAGSPNFANLEEAWKEAQTVALVLKYNAAQD